MTNMIRLAVIFALVVGVASNGWTVGASGFSTQFAGAKAAGQGNTFAAVADNPTALHYNPAGLTQLDGTQVSVGLTGLLPFTSRTGEGVPDDRIKKTLSVLPNFFLTSQVPNLIPSLGDTLTLGVGVTTPFGMSTTWAPTSSVRYVTTESKIELVNVNPTIAWEVSEKLSLAAGADYVNLYNTVSKSQINQAYANALFDPLDASPDGTSKLQGSGDGWGYNVGALYRPSPTHAVGLAYRSQVRLPITGTLRMTNLSPSSQTNYNFADQTYEVTSHTSLILPASVLAGYSFRMNDRWTFSADYEWTQWNSFENQDVAIDETDPSRLSFITGDSTSNIMRTPREWHNVSSFGLGANCQVNEQWQYRGGYAFFEKTVPHHTFNPDVPDSPVHLLSAGLTRSWKNLTFDAAVQGWIYTKRPVKNTVGSASDASVNGTYQTISPALAFNVTYKFGK